MKKLICLLLAVCLTLSFTGCSGDKKNTQTTTAENYYYMTPDKDGIIKTFSEAIELQGLELPKAVEDASGESITYYIYQFDTDISVWIKILSSENRLIGLEVDAPKALNTEQKELLKKLLTATATSVELIETGETIESIVESWSALSLTPNEDPFASKIGIIYTVEEYKENMLLYKIRV